MIVRLSTNDESADCHNNIVDAAAGKRLLALMTQHGTLNLHRHWLPTAWRISHSAPVQVAAAQ